MSRDIVQCYFKSFADLAELRIVESEDIIWRPCVTIRHSESCVAAYAYVVNFS